MVVVPELANAYGLHEALVLRQLHYWLQRATVFRDGKPWVYKTISEWSEEFTWWSRSTVHKLLTELARDGLITIVAEDKTYYTINYEMLSADCRAALLMLSEIRTEDKQEPADEASEIRTESPNSDVMLSEIRTEAHSNAVMLSENRTALSEIRTPNNKEVTESTTEITTKGEKSIAADAAPSHAPNGEVEKSKRSRKRRDPPSSEAPVGGEPTEWQEFVGAFCWLCHGHMEVGKLKESQKQALLSEAKVVKADGYSVDDLRNWYKTVWKHGWQVQKNKDSRPMPSDVRSSIAQLRATTPEGFEAESVGVQNNTNAAKNRQVVADVINRIKVHQGINGNG